MRFLFILSAWMCHGKRLTALATAARIDLANERASSTKVESLSGQNHTSLPVKDMAMLLFALEPSAIGFHIGAPLRSANRQDARAVVSLSDDEMRSHPADKRGDDDQHPAIMEIRRHLMRQGQQSLWEVTHYLKEKRDPALKPREYKNYLRMMDMHPEHFLVRGPRNSKNLMDNLLCTIAVDETEVLKKVVRWLQEDGPVLRINDLKWRLKETEEDVRKLADVLRQYPDTFFVKHGRVKLLEGTDEVSADDHLDKVKLHLLLKSDLPSTMEDLPPLDTIREVILLDMNGHAHAIEPTVERAQDPGTIVLGFADPEKKLKGKVLKRTARDIQKLAKAGRFRLLRPEAETKNAADFLLSFWVGWLHEKLPDYVPFVFASTDELLESTLIDMMRGGRKRHVEPMYLKPIRVKTRNKGWRQFGGDSRKGGKVHAYDRKPLDHKGPLAEEFKSGELKHHDTPGPRQAFKDASEAKRRARELQREAQAAQAR